MFTKVELLDAIDQLEDGKHSIQNCEKLAAIYTVFDHLYGEPKDMKADVGYSYSNEPMIGDYGDSKLFKAVYGKPTREVWKLINELVEALSVLNPRLLSNFYMKLDEL